MRSVIFNGIALLMVVFSLSCTGQGKLTHPQSAQETTIPAKQKTIAFLKDFYTAYITTCDSTSVNKKSLDGLKQKYLTPSLIKKLSLAELDYDPIIQAQDCDKNWLKTLEIKPDSNPENAFQVCYADSYRHSSCISLKVIKSKNGLLISDIAF